MSARSVDDGRLRVRAGDEPAQAIDLRALTPARVALQRTGCSVTTRHALEFSLAHAQARDAVHSALGVSWMMAELRERRIEAVAVRSAVRDRAEYLRRPDLGRLLSDGAAERLANARAESGREPDVALVLSVILADGLSALAVERHALPVLDSLLAVLELSADARENAAWKLAPVVVAEQARVALGDEIGVALGASVTVMLIGERPGLSSPASLGAYITWEPRRGRTDAERNCISNIRTEGLDYASAAARIAWFIAEARRLRLTGVRLRDGSMEAGGEQRAIAG